MAQNTRDIAENRRLIEEAFNEIEDTQAGVAMALALSSLTNGLQPGKRFALGLGFGTFKNQQAMAINMTFLFTDPNSPGVQILFNTGAGFGLNRDVFGASAGISIQW